MARGPRQRSVYRRRRSGDTDYGRRLKLLRNGSPRAVVRISNTQTTAQLVLYQPDGDVVVAGTTGESLVKKYGWPEGMSRKSIPASYLVGFALGKSALAAGHDEAILDIGLAASSRGGRVFSALKGMVDAGLSVPHGESVLPDDERINGAHIDAKVAKAVAASKAKIEGAF
ncbi:MAG: 50S ribosomal protein L18 [Candidatus Poseidoniaceae archaeon]|nr:50S ribosomal protein L18 [Candidatus Poseidoniaceae archaeon]